MSRTRTLAALVLRKYDYSETSQVLRLLSREHGVIGVLAKGSKKEKSAFGGPLDLFYRGEGRVVFRPRSELHILSSFRVTEAWRGLRRDLSRFYVACHLAEILIGLTREEEPLPAVYLLLVEGLSELADSRPEEIPPLGAALTLRLLAELGFAPSLDTCAACGRPSTGRERCLSVAQGGLLCDDCRDRGADVVPVRAGVLGALRNLARGPIRRARRLRLAPADARAIRRFLTGFTEWRLERKLRTARFLP